MTNQTCFFCLDQSNVVNIWATHIASAARGPFLDGIMIFMTNLGSPMNLSLFSLVLIFVFWLHGKYRHMVQFVLTLALGGLIIWLVKIYFHLPRPAGGLVPAEGYGFTSGHAANAVIFFSLLVYSYKLHIQSRSQRALFVAASALLALFIGLSRVYLGVHYFTDVLGGFLLGAVISAASVLIFRAYGKEHGA